MTGRQTAELTWSAAMNGRVPAGECQPTAAFSHRFGCWIRPICSGKEYLRRHYLYEKSPRRCAESAPGSSKWAIQLRSRILNGIEIVCNTLAKPERKCPQQKKSRQETLTDARTLDLLILRDVFCKLNTSISSGSIRFTSSPHRSTSPQNHNR